MASIFTSSTQIYGYSDLLISWATFNIIPEVSRITLGFSQTVILLKPRLLAYSKAAFTIRVTYFLVKIRVETANSGRGHQPKFSLNFGCVINASYTWSDGFVHST